MSTTPPLSPTPAQKDPFWQRLKRNYKGVLAALVILLLLIIIATESTIIFVQNEVNQQIQSQSDKSLRQFLRNPTARSASGGTNVELKNVQFYWSKQVYVDSDHLTAQIVPLEGGNSVNFDNLNSFIVNVSNADVLIRPDVLQGMFNESVFNYPNSKLRNLTVTIQEGDTDRTVQLNGSLKLLFWIPFEMTTKLSIDHKTNTLVITVNKLHIFGFLPITPLINLRPLHLEKLIALPANKQLNIHDNVIMIKPFGLFPPPRINGKMDSLVVESKVIRLRFNDHRSLAFPGLPNKSARNMIFVDGGNAHFGRLGMRDNQIEIVQNPPGKIFPFFLQNYLDQLPKSQLKYRKDGSIVVQMPGFKPH